MEHTLTATTLLIGGIILASIGFRYGAERFGLPALVGYLALGMCIGPANARWGLLTQEGLDVLEFLADTGVIVLLFRVGLESNLAALVERLPQTSVLRAGHVLVSGTLGYWAAHVVLGCMIVVSAPTVTPVPFILRPAFKHRAPSSEVA